MELVVSSSWARAAAAQTQGGQAGRGSGRPPLSCPCARRGRPTSAPTTSLLFGGAGRPAEEIAAPHSPRSMAPWGSPRALGPALGRAWVAAPRGEGGQTGVGASWGAAAEYERLLEVVLGLGDPSGLNVVAFSGGVDSSLVAHLVHAAFGERAMACVGVSPALGADQLARARAVAGGIGIALREVPTEEGSVPGYLANDGSACFHCKTELYTVLQRVGEAGAAAAGAGGGVALFNGTNADDLQDPTRVGILAATNFAVGSPLASIPKATVREVARHVGLPNWDTAASPCLRSRLELGVEATASRLAAVEAAEAVVRRVLRLDGADNMRVRVLRDGGAMLEVDEPRVEEARAHLEELRRGVEPLGLKPLNVRAFRSGSVAGPGARGLGPSP